MLLDMELDQAVHWALRSILALNLLKVRWLVFSVLLNLFLDLHFLPASLFIIPKSLLLLLIKCFKMFICYFWVKIYTKFQLQFIASFYQHVVVQRRVWFLVSSFVFRVFILIYVSALTWCVCVCVIFFFFGGGNIWFLFFAHCKSRYQPKFIWNTCFNWIIC